MKIIFRHKDGKINTKNLKSGDCFFDTKTNQHYLIGQYMGNGIYYQINLETGNFESLEENRVLKTNIEAIVNES